MATAPTQLSTLSTYQAMVDMAPDHILILEPPGRVVFKNRPVTSASQSKLLLKSLQARWSELQAAVKQDATSQIEFEVPAADGSPRWYHAHIRRLQQTADDPRILLFVRDVTERRQAQSELEQTSEALEKSRRQMLQAQKMESVGRLAGGVAHDFNNLLTSIISFSRFVLDDLAPGDPRRADLIEVLRAADSASKLTRQLLSFSRQRQVEPTILELNEGLTSIDKVLRRTLEELEEEVELVVLPYEKPLCVSIDPGQLDQILMNLVVNARDAMPEGGTLTVSVTKTKVRQHTELPAGDYACITVSDTGMGMTSEVASQVFEPFFSTKGEKGTGLGLSTVYGIVKQAEGHVEVTSELDKGTTFKVLLPVKNAKPRVPSIAPPPKPRKLSGIALVVEDQPAILRTIVRSISGAGFNVLHAHSAEEALALIEDLDPRLDLLVTDVMLPGLSGLRLTQRLRERSPGLRVVLCSGYLGERDDSQVPRDDKTVFLSKPFTGPQLVESASALFA